MPGIVYGSRNLKKFFLGAPKTNLQLPSEEQSPNPFFLAQANDEPRSKSTQQVGQALTSGKVQNIVDFKELTVPLVKKKLVKILGKQLKQGTTLCYLCNNEVILCCMNNHHHNELQSSILLNGRSTTFFGTTDDTVVRAQTARWGRRSWKRCHSLLESGASVEINSGSGLQCKNSLQICKTKCSGKARGPARCALLPTRCSPRQTTGTTDSTASYAIGTYVLIVWEQR